MAKNDPTENREALYRIRQLEHRLADMGQELNRRQQIVSLSYAVRKLRVTKLLHPDQRAGLAAGTNGKLLHYQGQ